MVLKAKHVVEEIKGQRCTIVEKGIDKDRLNFLKNLLEFNHFEVLVDEVAKTEESAIQLYNLGVTDLVFNPVIAVYEMSLKSEDGSRITAPYWNQETSEHFTEYWKMAK